MANTPDTSVEAWQAIRDAGDDVSLRLRVAGVLADSPKTVTEITECFPEHSKNGVQPRVTELVRMGCVRRDGKRLNPSGHKAYVHHLTATGERYLRGEVEPEPDPTQSELQAEVVEVARQYLRNDDVSVDILHLAVERHDRMKARMDPQWSSEPP